MALKVYYREDVSSAVVGLLVVAIETFVANGAGNTEHLIGEMTLARGIACSFGLSWPGLIATVIGSLDPEVAGMIGQGGAVRVVCGQRAMGGGPGRALSEK